MSLILCIRHLPQQVYHTYALQLLDLRHLGPIEAKLILIPTHAVALLLGNQHPAAHDYVAVFEQEHL